jgi:acyl-CoA thioesterase I
MARSYGTFAGGVEGRRTLFSHILVLVLALTVPDMTLASTAFAETGTPVKLVVLGDSLSAGLGLSAADAFPAKLQKALRDKGIAVHIGNAGVSGDTASGGRDRLDWSVPEGTKGVVVELGANDALKARGIPVLLCGMLAPPNYGKDYADRFNPIYPDLAKSFGVPLYPFFLDGVAADAKLNQADGIHPTRAGVDIIVKNIMPVVETFLGTIREQSH